MLALPHGQVQYISRDAIMADGESAGRQPQQWTWVLRRVIIIASSGCSSRCWRPTLARCGTLCPSISTVTPFLPLFTWEVWFGLAPQFVGSWRVGALPGNYGAEEWRTIASLLGIQAAAVGGFVYFLHK
jgi:hypothetical protein